MRLVLTTCPDERVADSIARRLVEAGYAACVNILPKGQSLYYWQGKVESAGEHVLLIKTPARQLSRVEECIRKLHPYELPEVIAVPILGGLPDYLAWLDNPRITE